LEKKSFYKAFDVKFPGLKLGEHSFDFQVNDDFFNQYEDSLVTKSNVAVKLILDKQSEVLYILNFEFNGSINLLCDRCLTQFDLPINENYRLIMKVDSEIENNEDVDIIFVSSHDLVFNVADYLYEFILIQLPLKVSCDMADLECDEEMTSKFDDIVIKENDTEENNPWAKLQELKNKFKED